MKYAFFGTPTFAAIILKKLIKAGFVPTVIICNPDRPVGRKKIITPPPTKVIATENNVKVIQPIHLEPSLFTGMNFDLFIIAAYAKIIPKKILEIPKLGAIGVHPSLLPRYRGATPIQTAILNGEKETGVTLFFLDEQVDHGPILESRNQKIENNDNYESLHDKLAELGGELLTETIPKYLGGEFTLHPQNEKEATYTKKFSDEDGYVDLEKDNPTLIERKVRALNPEPGVWTYTKALTNRHMRINENKRMKILEVELVDGKLKLKKIQFEGKTPQNL